MKLNIFFKSPDAIDYALTDYENLSESEMVNLFQLNLILKMIQLRYAHFVVNDITRVCSE